ncbi:YrhC family protein [Peribacillus sp. SCS-155]|uniref:YrhC family protein n=1 Tax=Peribacillus sedimenti TaxID=3115297 RepID=UPI0039062D4F
MGTKKTMAQIRSKMVDFKQYAITLLCVGIFFYLGSVIPSKGKTMFDMYGFMAATIVFLGLSVVFFIKSSKYNKQLSEMDDSL